VLIADAADDREPVRPTPPLTPRDRGLAARRVVEAAFAGRVVCGTCAGELLAVAVQAAVETAVEDAERDLRARMKEQMQWPN
jgi:hypothetical protein